VKKKKWWGEGWKRGPTYKDTVLDKKVLPVELYRYSAVQLYLYSYRTSGRVLPYHTAVLRYSTSRSRVAVARSIVLQRYRYRTGTLPTRTGSSYGTAVQYIYKGVRYGTVLVPYRTAVQLYRYIVLQLYRYRYRVQL
jgi:hypothetical protein